MRNLIPQVYILKQAPQVCMEMVQNNGILKNIDFQTINLFVYSLTLDC